MVDNLKCKPCRTLRKCGFHEGATTSFRKMQPSRTSRFSELTLLLEIDKVVRLTQHVHAGVA